MGKKCELVPHLINVTIDYCNCTEKEIWYNKLERMESQCVEETTSCVTKVVPVCKTVPVPKCKPVKRIDCFETCEDDCSTMHFRTPSQELDHRRWCSHVEIIVPPGVNVPPSGDRELTDKQSTNKATNSNGNIGSNPRSKKGNSFSNSKAATTYSNQRSNSQRTPNSDSLGSTVVYSRSGPASNRRSSVSQTFQGKQTIRQGQQIRG